MLETKNISLTLGGKTLFNGLSFSVSAGEMLCITGASGSGKTSLIKAIMGFLPIDGGFISIDGELVTAESASVFRRMMSYLPQDLSFPCTTVREMVSLPFSIRANNEVEYSKEILMKEWEKLNLSSDLYTKNVSEISGGQRLRMMIATTRLLRKKIMILDEPTSALDEQTTLLVADYLSQAAAEGTMIILVSHNAILASRCNKTIAL